jgi:hypothetical protein
VKWTEKDGMGVTIWWGKEEGGPTTRGECMVPNVQLNIADFNIVFTVRLFN